MKCPSTNTLLRFRKLSVLAVSDPQAFRKHPISISLNANLENTKPKRARLDAKFDACTDITAMISCH